MILNTSSPSRSAIYLRSKYPTSANKHAFFPPAKNVGGVKWLHLFYTPDKKDWKELEKHMLEKFNTAHEKHLMEQAGNGSVLDDIDL